jgi:hypothetical protein
MRTFSLDPQQNRDLAEFLETLNRARVRYAVVGAYAVMSHSGKHRVTKDLDVYVATDAENLKRLSQALGAFGAPANVRSIEALRPDETSKLSGVTFGAPPRRIDIMTKMELTFEEVAPRLELFEMNDQHIAVIGRSDLLALKRLAVEDDPKRGRKDRADIEALEARGRSH